MRVAKTALVVYTFLPLSMPARYLDDLGTACERLGMAALPPAAAPPADGGPGQFRVEASHRDDTRAAGGAVYEAVRFVAHDVRGSIVCMAPNTLDDSLDGWRARHAEWVAAHRPVAGSQDATLAPLPSGALGEVLVFQALSEDATGAVSPSVTASVMAALPGEPARTGKTSTLPYRTSSGFCIWEAPPLDGRRVVAVLAPVGEEDAVTEWILWDSEGLFPFPRYLMHAAKLRYETALYDAEQPALQADRAAVDALTDELASTDAPHAAAAMRPADVFEHRRDLNRRHDRARRLAMRLVRVRELHETAKIIENNLQRLTPPPGGSRPPQRSLFSVDVEQARWLRDQTGNDIAYLEATRDRARDARALAGLVLSEAAEQTRRRQTELTLLQTTLVTGLLAAVGAIQALTKEVIGDAWSRSATIWAITALTLLLPPLIVHWHEHYGRLEKALGGLVGAPLLLLAARLLPPTRAIWGGAPVAVPLVVAALGFLVGWLVVSGLDRLGSAPATAPSRTSSQE
jgi:hypothetical protein